MSKERDEFGVGKERGVQSRFRRHALRSYNFIILLRLTTLSGPCFENCVRKLRMEKNTDFSHMFVNIFACAHTPICK